MLKYGGFEALSKPPGTKDFVVESDCPVPYFIEISIKIYKM
jgi:hypothetical protein